MPVGYVEESQLHCLPGGRYRGFDYPGMLAEVRREMPSVAHGFVIGGEGEESFEGHFLDRPWEREIEPQRSFAERRPGPWRPAEPGVTCSRPRPWRGS